MHKHAAGLLGLVAYLALCPCQCYADRLDNTPKNLHRLLSAIAATDLEQDKEGLHVLRPKNHPEEWKGVFADCESETCRSFTFYSLVPVADAQLEEVNRMNESIRYTRLSLDSPHRIAMQMDIYFGRELNEDVVGYLFKRWLSDLKRVREIFGGNK